MAIGKKTGGRKAGTPNKENKALREMILQALDDQPGGGVEYLKIQAQENPNSFMTLLGKVLPTTLAGDPNAPLTGLTVTFVKPDGKSS
jgi:hypothetical protein